MSDIATPPAADSDGRRRVRVAVAAVCGVVVAAVVLWWPRTTVVKVFSQPPAVAYSDGSGHVAVLKRVRAPIAGLQAAVNSRSVLDHYEVVLGRDPGGGYGHRVRVDATGLDAAELTVEWTADGAWLGYPSGHRMFVPAAGFTGGR
jgi:hypothetical protein